MKFKSVEKEDSARQAKIDKYAALAEDFVNSDSIEEYLVKRDTRGCSPRCNFFDIFYVAWWKREHAASLKAATTAYVFLAFVVLAFSVMAFLTMVIASICYMAVWSIYNHIYCNVTEYVREANKGNLYLELHDQMKWF